MQDFLVFDLETQRSAQDVGGWDKIPEMKMSVGVLYDSRDKKFHCYTEDKVEALIQHLCCGSLVIGYNHLKFDYPVLSGYRTFDQRAGLIQRLEGVPNLDLLLDLRARIGKRVKLDAVARATLEIGKSADGLQALVWYKEYLDGDTAKLGMITDYCKQDVAVTRDVYLYGIEHNEVKYLDKEKGIQVVAVNWEQPEEEPKPPDSSEQLSLF